MYRDIFHDLKIWKEDPERKPILLQGARQVGKTWVMKTFGKDNYENYAFFDFDESPELKEIFKTTKDPHRIVKELALYTEFPIQPQKTLIIFDEIQLCEEALNSLKYFKENAPEFHVMAAGSLLGVAIRKKKMPVPVGKVNMMKMYPMTFREFLRAGNKEVFDYVSSIDAIAPLPEIIFNKLKTEFRRYQICGGMPEAVLALLENKGIRAVDKVLQDILNLYELDFSQYADPSEILKIKAVWHSLPTQLSKENRKFIYKLIRTGARAKEYESALEWLKEAGLIYKLCDVSNPGVPLSAYMEPDIFKIYALDCGIMRRLAGLESSVILDPAVSYVEFKGAFAENIVLQSLMPSLEDNSYAYWTSQGRAEIDLILQRGGEIIPVEIKAEDNVSGKSLSVYIGKYEPKNIVRISMQNLKQNDRLLNCPLPLACWLPTFLQLNPSLVVGC